MAMDVKSLYAAILGGGMPQGGAPMSDTGQMEAAEPAPMPRMPEDTDPRTQQGDTFFVDPAMLRDEKKAKKGDSMIIRAKVKSVGSKIALTPVDISYENVPDEEEDDFDGTGETADKESSEHEMPGLHNEVRN